MLGRPRVHHAVVDSTNVVARGLAASGAPHGTTVTAAAQTAGRGRQGRTWSAPPGSALLLSVILRGPVDPLLPLRAAVAVAELADADIKWPNDVLIGGRKLCGILAEGRPAEHWAVLGIGVNVAVRVADLPEELHTTATSLELPSTAVEPFCQDLLHGLDAVLALDPDALLARWSARDALLGREVRWADGSGTAAGVDATGALLVRTTDGTVALDAGEVHLQREAG